jgi:rubredoxin
MRSSQVCGAPRYAELPGMRSSQVCGAPRYAELPGMRSSQVCGAPRYAELPGMRSSQVCGAPRYAELPGMRSSQVCGAPRYAELPGMRSSQVCGAPRYAELPGMRSSQVCGAPRYACLFDRPERTPGARGGSGSAHARSRAPLWSGREYGETRRGATARDGFPGAQTDFRLPAPHWPGAGSQFARAAGSRARRDGAGALCLVGGADRPGVERGHHVASHAPSGLDT